MQTRQLILSRAALAALTLCANIAAATEGAMGASILKAGDAQLAVVLGTNPNPAEMRVAELLAERIKERSGIALTRSVAQAKFRLVIGTTASNANIKEFAATRKEVASLAPDGYVIAVEPGKPELAPWPDFSRRCSRVRKLRKPRGMQCSLDVIISTDSTRFRFSQTGWN